jgi:hypothetical protein
MRRCMMVGGLKLPQLTSTVGCLGAATPMRHASLSVGSCLSALSGASAVTRTYVAEVVYLVIKCSALAHETIPRTNLCTECASSQHARELCLACSIAGMHFTPP